MLIDALREINFILFPKWSEPEAAIAEDLEAVLQILFAHPNRADITLLIDSQNLSEELQDAANLLLFQIILKFTMEDTVPVSEELNVGLTGQLSATEWQAARSLLNFRIFIPTEDPLTIEQLGAEQIPVCSLSEVAQTAMDASTWLASWLRWADYFTAQGSLQNAIAYYQKYLSQQPQQAEIYLKLSNIYRQLAEPSLAAQVLQTGVGHCPQARELYFWLIVRLNENSDYLSARSVAQQAASAFPEDYTFKFLSHLLLPQTYNTPEEIETYRAWFEAGLEALIQETPLNSDGEKKNALQGISHVTNFFLAYQGRNDRALQHRYGDLVHQVMAANYPEWVQPRPLPAIASHQKLRIGYLSAFLCAWSGTLLFLNWLKYADQQQFEIYAYHIGETVDPVTELFQQYSTKFYHLPTSLESICQQVLDDQLHGLIFPELGMDARTLCIAGLRLAPVQCMAWGQPVTSGLPTMDYFLSSELMEPANGQDHYTENLVRLPGVGISYPPVQVPPAQQSRAAFGLREDAIVYLSSQAPYKYLPQYDFIYAEIARQIPKAQFMFLRRGIPTERLDRAFAAVGLNSQDFCVFSPVLPRREYFELLSLCDVYLDTLDWAGGNTTLDAIMCHLPIVTYAGEFMRGRHSYGFLQAMGVTETIAASVEQYVAISVKLARDPDWRHSIREAIKDSSGALFDNPTCTQNLETFLKQALAQR